MSDKKQQQHLNSGTSYLQVPDNNNPNNNGNNLSKRQQAIQKKHSGPLDDALAELQRQQQQTTTTTTTTLPTTTTCHHDHNDDDNDDNDDDDYSDDEDDNEQQQLRKYKTIKPRKSSLIKDTHHTHHTHHAHYAPYSHHGHHSGRNKQRERWLLTRKTWKFMQDAGKKLIPDGAKNTREDIPLIEENFQQICASETRFIVWRRKCSFPGALRMRGLRPITLHRHQQQQQQRDKLLQLPANLHETADQTIELLRTYLAHMDHMAGVVSLSNNTTALLSSKTQQPHQTSSPSSQRPTTNKATTTTSAEQINGQLDLLLVKLRQLAAQLPQQQTTTSSHDLLPLAEHINHDYLLKNKTQLRYIYNALKRQQLHRQVTSRRQHVPAMPYRTLSMGNLNTNTTTTTTPIGLNYYDNSYKRNTAMSVIKSQPNVECGENVDKLTTPAKSHAKAMPVILDDKMKLTTPLVKRQIKPPHTLNLTTSTQTTTSKAKTMTAAARRLHYNNCGTQTNFIPLQDIKQLAAEYQQQLQLDKVVEPPEQPTTGSSTMRKSSLENADISPTVSDTIKRYLRMARKKSLTTANAAAELEKKKKAQFQRINYDRQLRMIKARGEINPPGMDEDNNKAVQTLDAWPLIMLDFIRNNCSDNLQAAHDEWHKQLQQRLQRKLDYELQQQHNNNNNNNNNNDGRPNYMTSTSDDQGDFSSSATISPTSPPPHQLSNSPGGGGGSSGGLLAGTTQFLSNLWHATSSSALGGGISGEQLIDVNMQKSKSSSHVGHFVTKKILRNRSKSQTRSYSPPTAHGKNNNNNQSKWTPSENLIWMSDRGECISLRDTSLEKLSDLEYQYLQRIARQKIIELNIGIDVNLEKELNKSKSRGLLPKKRSMTTSFFDIGSSRKDDSCLFGSSLESSVAKDQKYWHKVLASLAIVGGGGGGGSRVSSERGSRNSIASMFRLSGHESVRSCESLPTNQVAGHQNKTKKSKVGSKLMSKSQCDIRDESDGESSSASASLLLDSRIDLDCDMRLRVPSFVSTCLGYLEDTGLQTVGLFRVSTSKKRVKQLREELDKQQQHTSSMTSIIDSPHDAATLLKEYLRDLPEPLINDYLYQSFLKTQKIRNRRLQLEAVSHLVKLLPVAHRDTLFVLLRFLAKVSAHADDVCAADGSVELTGNKMDSYNLATVFAPNILRPYTKASTSNSSTTADYAASTSFSAADRRDANMQQQNMTDAINVVRILIDHYEEIFRVPGELVHSIYAHMLDTCPAELNLICAKKSQMMDEMKTASLPATPTASTTSSNTNKTNADNRLFTRESVMHMNDATRISAETASSSSSSSMQPIAMKRSRSTKHTKLLRRQSTPTELSSAGYNNNLNDYDDDGVTATKHDHNDDNDNDVEGKIVTASLQISMAFKPKTTTTTTNKINQNDKTKKSDEQQQQQQQQQQRNVKTPPEPASITNIGGAILRSKTQDFERISAVNQKLQQQQQQSSQTPLYKRQQLIRSAKTTFATKTIPKIES